MQIFDRNGQTVAAIEKLTLRTVSAEQLQPKKLLDSYEIKWQKQPLEVVNEQNLSGENWLIFVEPGILAAQFETALPNAILVKSGKSFQKWIPKRANQSDGIIELRHIADRLSKFRRHYSCVE